MAKKEDQMDAFRSEWPRMVEDRLRGTVLTTNGGEITGLLSSYGTSYPVDVECDDGHWVGIGSSRVAGVRLAEEGR